MRTAWVLVLLLAVGCKGGDAKEAAAAGPGAGAAAAGKATGAAAGGSESAAGELTVGQEVPDFTLNDLDGKPVSLKDHRGKVVVVEWYNPDCPFVKAAHTEGPLKDMAKRNAEKGVVWLAINSGAAGKQGNGLERNRVSVREYELANPVLLDEAGAVGRAWGATATPHMYVIDAAGKLVYRGALDNKPLGRLKGDTYTPYTQDGIDAALAGRAAPSPVTQAWGCAVKYGD